MRKPLAIDVAGLWLENALVRVLVRILLLLLRSGSGGGGGSSGSDDSAGDVFPHELLHRGREEIALERGDAAGRLCGNQVDPNDFAVRPGAIQRDLRAEWQDKGKQCK